MRVDQNSLVHYIMAGDEMLLWMIPQIQASWEVLIQLQNRLKIHAIASCVDFTVSFLSLCRTPHSDGHRPRCRTRGNLPDLPSPRASKGA